MTSTLVPALRPRSPRPSGETPVLRPAPVAAARPKPRWAWQRVGYGAAVVGLLGVAGSQYERLTEPARPRAVASALPAEREVTTVSPAAGPVAAELLLPAQLLPYEQTTLFARVDGYVAKWHADRGARVKTGDLLAEIDAPELDEQAHRADAALDQGRAALAQLRADVEQARADVDAAIAQVTLAEANRSFAASELDRVDRLSRAGAVSRSEVEGNGRNRDVTAAQVAAARADVTAKEKLAASRAAAIGTQEAAIRSLAAEAARLRELQKFKRIVAPFDGTVTRRHAEVGMLLSTVTPQPLFHVQNSATLRVQVDVPQGHAAAARGAKSGDVIVPEFPDRPLTAKVARTANALDPLTRTLRVELELPNPDRAVLAGTYARVRLAAAARPAVLVPTAALRYSPQGVQVVAVAGGRTEVRPVSLGRDYGKAVEVLSGLTGGEELVVNPADDLRTGEAVRVAGRRAGDPAPTALAAAWPAKSK